jgi:hypothetical protein
MAGIQNEEKTFDNQYRKLQFISSFVTKKTDALYDYKLENDYKWNILYYQVRAVSLAGQAEIVGLDLV